jgi:hypothetical protein
VTIHDPYTGDGVMGNVVVARGHRLTCPEGEGSGCAVSVTIAQANASTGFGGMAGSVRHHDPRP